ncbi:MAG: fructose-6-phosphate aldolase [Bacteroidia bacterium]|nr:fructose-6-phosphate aldolase [Bacteroidia bacterium]
MPDAPPSSPKTYYLLKVKGKAKIPDYIQVRDAQFTLVGYFRPGRTGKPGPGELTEALYQAIEAHAEALPFGRITQVEFQ